MFTLSRLLHCRGPHSTGASLHTLWKIWDDLLTLWRNLLFYGFEVCDRSVFVASVSASSVVSLICYFKSRSKQSRNAFEDTARLHFGRLQSIILSLIQETGGS